MTADSTNTDQPAILGGRALFSDASAAWPPTDEAVSTVLRQMADDGSWGRYFGPYCDGLIARLREMHDCEHVILCSSGRSAVELALLGLGISSNCEVALAAYDFHSNFAAIHRAGAMPFLVDVQLTDAQLDVDQLASAVSPDARAVIASHLHGGVVDLPRVRRLADERGIAVIEDACQAGGATVAGRPAGMWGDVGVLSFGGSKLLTAGRGGALLTNRDDVVQRIRRELRGDNHMFPLSEMQAAVLMPQLERLAERHQQRTVAVEQIRAALIDCDGLRLLDSNLEDSSPAYYKVGLFYDPRAFDGLSRDQFITAMQAERVPLDAGFAALHRIHSRHRFRAVGELSAAAIAEETVLGLHHPILCDPHFNWTLLRQAVERIRHHVDSLRN